MSTQSTFVDPIVTDYLSLERTVYMASASSKKKVMELLSKTIAITIPQITESILFDSFFQRERLGSTAIGKGFALPHCRAKEIEQIVGCFMRLKEPIDFDALDNQPVDLVFALVVPFETTELHLKVLANIAETFKQDAYMTHLRKSQSQEELFKLLTHVSP
jgi:PTS system nitrogen regulatory IIA component